MSSSSAPQDGQRENTRPPQDGQRENTRLPQDAPPNSAIGTVKNIIATPFSSLMGPDDYEGRNGPGKRRRTATAPATPTEEEVQYLGTSRAPVKRVRYQTDQVSASLR